MSKTAKEVLSNYERDSFYDANILKAMHEFSSSKDKRIRELEARLETYDEILNEYYNHLVEQDKTYGLNVYSDQMKSRILKIIIPS